MALKKWIAVKSPREPAATVAARMFRSRLRGVAHYLQLAAKLEQDPEHVHQLRVWTRRAEAVLELCAGLIRKRQRKSLECDLQHVLKAAAAARDADVLYQYAAATPPGVAQEHLAKVLQERRKQAQESIQHSHEQLQGGKKLLRQLQDIEQRLQARSGRNKYGQPFRKWSRTQLELLVRKFLKRGKQDLTDLAALHRFRVSGKRLKYALELVAGAYQSKLRKLYRHLDDLQTELGQINDLRQFVAQVEAVEQEITKCTLKVQVRRFLNDHWETLSRNLDSWHLSWSRKRRRKLKRMLTKLF